MQMLALGRLQMGEKWTGREKTCFCSAGHSCRYLQLEPGSSPLLSGQSKSSLHRWKTKMYTLTIRQMPTNRPDCSVCSTLSVGVCVWGILTSTRSVLKFHLILLKQSADLPCATWYILHLICLQCGLQGKNESKCGLIVFLGRQDLKNTQAEITVKTQVTRLE